MTVLKIISFWKILKKNKSKWNESFVAGRKELHVNYYSVYFSGGIVVGD